MQTWPHSMLTTQCTLDIRAEILLFLTQNEVDLFEQQSK